MADGPVDAADLQRRLDEAEARNRTAEANAEQMRVDKEVAERRLADSQAGLIGQLGQALSNNVGAQVTAAVKTEKNGNGFVYRLSLSSDKKTDRNGVELENQDDPKVVDDVTAPDFLYQEISNGVGDLPIPEHLLLAFHSGIWPALSVFDDSVIAFLSAHFFTFLHPGATSKDVAKGREKMIPFQHLDRLLSLSRALSAFLKFGEVIKTYCCKTETARRKLNSDFKYVVSDVVTRTAEPGKEHIGVIYLLLVLSRLRTGMTAKLPWDKNRASAFSEGAWKTAIQDSGGNAKADFFKVDETEDKALSAFGAAIKIAYNPTNPGQAAKTLATVIQEQRKLTGAVLNGEQPDVGIPKSLKYEVPSSLLNQRDGEAGKVTTRRGGRDGQPREDQKPYFSFPFPSLPSFPFLYPPSPEFARGLEWSVYHLYHPHCIFS